MLGTQGRQILFEILRAVAAGNGEALLGCVGKLDAQAPDYSSLLNDLASILQRIAVLQVLPEAAEEDDDGAVRELAGAVAAEDVQVYYQIVINGRRDLPWVPDPRMGFEMTLLRLLAFRPDPGGAPRVAAGSPAAAAKPAGGTRAAAPPPAAPTATPADAAWSERVETLGLDGFPKQLARNCEWLGRSGDTVRLALDPKVKHLLQDERRAAIEQALSRQAGEALRVTIELSAGGGLTPARQDQQRESERQLAAERAIESDPAVRALKEKFGATVRAGSVQPAVPGNGNGVTK